MDKSFLGLGEFSPRWTDEGLDGALTQGNHMRRTLGRRVGLGKVWIGDVVRNLIRFGRFRG